MGIIERWAGGMYDMCMCANLYHYKHGFAAPAVELRKWALDVGVGVVRGGLGLV